MRVLVWFVCACSACDLRVQLPSTQEAAGSSVVDLRQLRYGRMAVMPAR
jgi:hypothetical protein